MVGNFWSKDRARNCQLFTHTSRQKNNSHKITWKLIKNLISRSQKKRKLKRARKYFHHPSELYPSHKRWRIIPPFIYQKDFNSSEEGTFIHFHLGIFRGLVLPLDFFFERKAKENCTRVKSFLLSRHTPNPFTRRLNSLL